MNKRFNFALLAISILSMPLKATQSQQTLSYKQAVKSAINSDVWQQGNQLKQQALVAKSYVASVLPEPVISMSLANIASDSFAINQEQMSQVKVGFSQQFARGDSLALSRQRLLQLSQQFPMLGKDREAKLATLVGETWLRAYLAQQTMVLIKQDRPLFEQLIELAQRSYQVGQGHTMQNDLVSAQLQLTQLDDRIAQLDITRQTYQQQLHQWLPSDLVMRELSTELPMIRAKSLPLDNRDQSWANRLADHPAVLVLNAQQLASNTMVSIAQEHSKVKWGINGNYGWRSDTPAGESRADLVSIGVTFDVPMFNHHKHRQQINAAKAGSQVIRTDKILLIKRFKSSALALKSRLTLLAQRQSLYQKQLLPQTRQQTEAVLSAYSNAQGDFSLVILARVNELNRRIDSLNIDIEQRISTLKLNYFLTDTLSSKIPLPNTLVGQHNE